ncbi:MAG: T9SS type A sorting domain-containing protein [Deltaproteobacteria bacterium]
MVQTGGDDPSTHINESTGIVTPELLTNEETMDQWINFGIFTSIMEGGPDFAEEILNPLVTWKWQKRLFGVKMIYQQYGAAELILNNMVETEPDIKFFKDVQRINLKLLSSLQTKRWNITDADIDYLKQIAMSKYPSRGYAHTLYRKLTGIDIKDRIKFQDNMKNAIRLRESTTEISEGEKQYSVFPNPANSQLNISVANNKTIEYIDVIDGFGHNMARKYIGSNNADLDISEYNSGIYFVIITCTDKEQFTEKVFFDTNKN